MNEDKQDNMHSDDSNASSDEAVMEQVIEDRVAKKQGGYLGKLLLVVMLIGAGVAAWYYQSIWLPQAQQWWASLMPTQEAVDPMAAPGPRGVEAGQASSEGVSSGYVLSAITDEKPTEETTENVVAEAPTTSATAEPVFAPTSQVPAAVAMAQTPESPAVSPAADAAKDVSNDIVLDEMPAAINDPADTAQSVLAVPPAPVGQDTSTVASIGQARQAFWARDLVKAEHLYREFLKREPTVADAWGELGNIYYGQAKWQQAADAYAQASIQLLDQGQYAQAMFLHYVVRGLDPAQATRIDEKMRAMQATPRG